MQTQPIRQTEAVSIHTGAVINGVQTEAEVLMARHNPADWPKAEHALARWEALCNAMKAVDHVVPLKAMRMNTTTGGMYNSAKVYDRGIPPGITPTRTALQHLSGFLGEDKPSTGVVDNLEWYPPDVRAVMLQALLAKAKDRSVVMRTAVSPQTDSLVIRAVASELHSKEFGDDAAIIAQMRRLNLTDAKMRIIKQWDSTHVEVVFPNKAKTVRPGVVINTRVNIENSETKGGSFEASVGTLNLVCINGMVGSGNNSTVTVRHMGDIRTKMRAGMVTVIDLAEVYLEEYMEAYKAPLPKTRAEVIEATVKRFALPKDTGASLATLWDIDGERGGGDTVAGLANAMTRLAQQKPVEQALRLEAAAGAVVSNGAEAFL